MEGVPVADSRARRTGTTHTDGKRYAARIVSPSRTYTPDGRFRSIGNSS
jgi:hypothetical protein